jgi:hypothetical protein
MAASGKVTPLPSASEHKSEYGKDWPKEHRDPGRATNVSVKQEMH